MVLLKRDGFFSVLEQVKSLRRLLIPFFAFPSPIKPMRGSPSEWINRKYFSVAGVFLKQGSIYRIINDVIFFSGIMVMQ
jgi:hypothetical protein